MNPRCTPTGHKIIDPAQLADAITHLVNTWTDSYLADSIGTQLTCTELEALTQLFDAAGADETATMWSTHHATGDDEGDDHNPDGSLRRIDHTPPTGLLHPAAISVIASSTPGSER